MNAAAIQLAMIMTSASAFVLTWPYVDDDNSAWFATCGVTRGASAGIIAPLDSTAGPELSIWGPELYGQHLTSKLLCVTPFVLVASLR